MPKYKKKKNKFTLKHTNNFFLQSKLFFQLADPTFIGMGWIGMEGATKNILSPA